MDFKVISIGALAAHPLWGERAPVRTGHATTTLITSGSKRILVDPGLPEQILLARLSERTNLKPSDITHVFLTSFLPDTRRALLAFEDATWWVSNEERDAVGAIVAAQLKQMVQSGDADPSLKRALENDIAILKRCQPPPENLAERVDVFPMHGVTPGLTGLLLSGPRHTTIICGDAIPTIEHLEQGKVLPMAADIQRAQSSFEEALEVADLLILGRDNIVVNPTRRPF
jgi:glyoxylase-like metal-dependent hydrolase (beta-lactamase superfamily II)